MQLEVTDKIKVTIQRYDALLEESVETYKAYISQETQAVALQMAAQLSDAVEVEMDGFTMHLKLMKA
jgi:isoleucyl-tRNA synthetase